MRIRLTVAAATLGALALALPSALAAPAPPTLDGKKVTKLEIKGNGGLQNNADNPAPETCEMPRCTMLPFVYNPAKGVAGNVMFTLKWDNLASDMDLYLAEVGKSANIDIGHCASAGASTTESFYAPVGTMKKGKTYALVIDYYRSLNDNVVGTVSMPSDNKVKTTVPANVDSLASLNCTM